MDINDCEFNDPQSGYDLDAIENLSPDLPKDTDTDEDECIDTDSDTFHDEDFVTYQGCGCRVIKTKYTNIFDYLQLF